MKHTICLLVVMLFATQAFSVDAFNTYQWNRKNHIENNSKVDNGQWFEWWYYKVVIPETNKSYYFVYGVVNPWDTQHTLKGTRSYIGAGDFENRVVLDKHYPVSQFSASYEESLVSLPEGGASDIAITGNISDENGNEYQWDISIKNSWRFNAEGWMLGTGFTNIEWYPAQADATCSGQIISNGEVVKFKDAPCYQDRNWGKSFPGWWTWIVSNKFDDHPGTALALGGGKPSIYGMPSPYEGVCIGLKHKGVQYKFRPNDLDYVSVDINFGKWEVVGISRNRKTKIEISAYAPEAEFMDLQFITPEGEVFHDYEALTGDVQVKLYQRKNFFDDWELVETLSSPYTGIEYGSTDENFVNSIHSIKMTLF